MNIHDALKQLKDWRKAEYFKWKFDIRYDQRLPKKTEEEFLQYIQRKTLNPYIVWERSKEYKALVALYLDSQISNDLQEIYQKVSEQAKTGDVNAVKLYLQLSKEIQQYAKNAGTILNNPKQEEEPEDDFGLEI